MASINNPLFFILIKSTEINIGETGATLLSEALKSNTTLTGLNLSGEHKRNNTEMACINKPLLFSRLKRKQTGNNIGEKGTKPLSDALKSNTTLTELDLRGSDKKKPCTNDIHQKSLFSILNQITENKLQDKGATSMSDALKSNVTLKILNLRREFKKKQHANNIQQTLFHSQ